MADLAAEQQTAAMHDRAAGVLMGMASGDALGAPHEFGPPLPDGAPLAMTGGGSLGWAPGEWTDDTQMAVVILRAAEHALADSVRLTEKLDDIARGWDDWHDDARDVGAQTSAVLDAAGRSGAVTADALRHAATEHHRIHGRSGGNGSLMRTAPVALAYLDDETAMAGAARAISELTHHDPDAGDACVLWCAAIRHAVLAGDLDVRRGFPLIPVERQGLWAARIADAEARRPADFAHNGWVVEALQAAWCAIATTPVPVGGDASGHLRLATEAAVRGGRDADTVAAIAGSLLGARWGASAIPEEWHRVVHGWPGLDVTELGRRGLGIALRSSAVALRDPGATQITFP